MIGVKHREGVKQDIVDYEVNRTYHCLQVSESLRGKAISVIFKVLPGHIESQI